MKNRIFYNLSLSNRLIIEKESLKIRNVYLPWISWIYVLSDIDSISVEPDYKYRKTTLKVKIHSKQKVREFSLAGNSVEELSTIVQSLTEIGLQ